MKNHIKDKFKKIPKHIWILLGIILIGTFLRSYHFHDWLDFGSDQVNDAAKVEQVAKGETPWPLLGPDMSDSGSGGRRDRFHLGPMYYYFEITSAKIFGNKPDSLAYPDLLFSVLSIPLLYYFLRRYFAVNLSLLMTGLYAVSFYLLEFSHSAWNPNSIPFFTFLYLLSLFEFVVSREKTRWSWIILLGMALGVAVQLHAILLVLFPAMAFFVFLYLMKKNWKVWNRWAVVILIALVLNLGQIISEQETGYKNANIFLSSITSPKSGKSSTLLSGLDKNISCHIQANAYMLSSIGNDACNFSIIGILRQSSGMGSFYILWIFLCFLFSLGGYSLLVYNFRKEKNREKRYFLGLIMLYAALSFLVMLPEIDRITNSTRYFIHVFFIPLIFLGFIAQYLFQKYHRKYATIAVYALFLIFFIPNIASISADAKDYLTKTESGPDKIVLGEIEPMVEYMMAQSAPGKEAYLTSDAQSANFLKSLEFIAEEKNFHLSVLHDNNKPLPQDKPMFYILEKSEKNSDYFINNHQVEDCKKFGQVSLYKLKNN
jgi:hypothetical protein